MASTELQPEIDLTQQQIYYNKRANEYDQWWLRQNTFNRGTEFNQKWENEKKVCENFFIKKLEHSNKNSVLELANGTGNWTVKLLDWYNNIKAIDGSTEMIAICSQKLQNHKNFANLSFSNADIFKLFLSQNEEINLFKNKYDGIFAGFFLSHIPPAILESFLASLKQVFQNGHGYIMFIDSKKYNDNHHKNASDFYEERVLNNDEKFTIIKVYFDTQQLTQQFNKLGFTGEILETDNFFIVGYFYI